MQQVGLDEASQEALFVVFFSQIRGWHFIFVHLPSAPEVGN